MKLILEKPVYGGDTLARLAKPDDGPNGKPGKAVFVPLGLPGETVEAHLIEDKRTSAKVEIDAILNPSPHRVAPPCPNFGLCGGCQIQHADYATQLALKQQVLRELLSRANVPLPSAIDVLSGNPLGYRNRIRLATTPAGELSYRSRRSHDLIPIRECPIAAPILIEAALLLRESLKEAAISEIELFTNAQESELLVTLFCEQLPATDTASCLNSLQERLPRKAGLRLQRADGALSPTILAESGLPSLTYTAAGFGYRVDQGAFFQVNRWLVDGFLASALNQANGATAWDLYAGVGLFARQFTQSFKKVVAVESAPASLAALKHNLSGTNAEAIASTTLDYLRRNREERQPRPDMILLDPPRAGLGDQVTTLLNAIGAPRIAYVSCDPTTLARDLRALTLERYRIEQITLVDMFPQTFHIETVVHLTRS